jgi:glucosyl-dolichyl phosphate glucuronosyltransferase
LDHTVIICSRNRLPDLQQTVAALREVAVPDGWRPALLLVDNSAEPEIAAALAGWNTPGWRIEVRHERRPGLSRARNCGLSGLRTGWITFTDDDVRPEPDWLVRLASRMREGKCDALAGAVKLAPGLERPWMNRRHRGYLAATEGLETGWLEEMVGANMSFDAKVLGSVPGFDEELGAGALGFGE